MNTVAQPYGIDDTGHSIETVTVEATHLMDWPKFALVVTLFLVVLKLTK